MSVRPRLPFLRFRFGLGKWLQTRKPSDWMPLVWLLAIVLVFAAGIWYGRSGHNLLDPFFSNRSPSSQEDASGLPILDLSIPHDAYQVLNTQWREALQKGILQASDRQWLSAQARFQEKTMPIQMWLEWEGIDHRQESKWPFQIRIQDETTILGMHSFSARPPVTGRCLDEWLYVQELCRVDVLAPRYAFVNVFVNGDDWGVYAIKEDFSQAWFDSQMRQTGVIVHLQDSLFWGRWTQPGDVGYQYWNIFADSMTVTSDLPAFAQVQEIDADNAKDDQTLSKRAVTALGLLRAFQSQTLAASTVFDAERMGRYIAHTNLWGTRQGTIEHDEYYYYNPSTSQLEPIGYDRFASLPRNVHLTDLAQYDDPEVMRAFVQEVLRISRPEYLDELRTRYGRDIERYYAALAQQLPAVELELPWDTLARRQVSLLAALHPQQSVHVYQSSADPLGQATNSTVELKVGNLSRYPVVLQQLQIGKHSVDIAPEWVAPENADRLYYQLGRQIVLKRVTGTIPQYVILHIPAATLQELRSQGASSESDTLQIVTSLVGVEEPIVVDVDQDYPAALSAALLPSQPSLSEALQRYPFLETSDRPGFLELKPGTWAVDGDLVLPAGIGLQATRPVTLTFDPGAVLLSSGPLLLRGQERAGIHFVPKQEDWGGIAVIRADSQVASLLIHVEIQGTTGIHRGGWIMEGGVTFYESAVVLQHCRLLDSAAPGAIRVVRTHFEFTDTEFANSAQNAFDSDFAQGRIEGCAFHDVIENAIDVKQSQVSIHDVDLIRVHDKGILASQDSVVAVQALRATDVGIAIASQDMSYVNAQDVRIFQASVAGFAAYTGETGYGPAVIQASQVVFEEDESTHALVQQESSITLNGMDAVALGIDMDDGSQIPGATRVLNYRLGPTIRLIGYDLSPTQLSPGDTCELVLYWQALARPPLDYTIFVHLTDSKGQYVAGWDTMPRNNAFPTSQWLARTTVDDIHHLVLPADLPPGNYQISLGMYYWPTQERLPVYDSGGAQVPDARVVLERTIEIQ